LIPCISKRFERNIESAILFLNFKAVLIAIVFAIDVTENVHNAINGNLRYAFAWV
jgi:hypothetical protein